MKPQLYDSKKIDVPALDDVGLFALADVLDRAVGLQSEAEAQTGRDGDVWSAATYCGAVVAAMASLRAGSIEALLIQARGLVWLYSEDATAPDVDVGPSASTEQTLIRSLVLGLHALAVRAQGGIARD